MMPRNPIFLALLAATLILWSPPAGAQGGPMDLFISFSRSQLVAQGFTRHAAEVAGHEMVWWEKGTGPTLVLVHGVADQAGTWFQVTPSLTENYRVLLVDLPGHGESAPVSGPLTMSTVVEGFESWLAAHAQTQEQTQEQTAETRAPILVGNSMGAWVSILASFHRPELVERVVAVNGGPLRADTGALNLLPKDREEARRLMAALRDPNSPPTPDLVLDDLVRRAPHGQVARMFEELNDLENHLLDGRLDEVITPVDILWGKSDRYMGRDYPHRLRAELPNVHLTLIPRCGHLPQAECPQHFAHLLGEILRQPKPGEPNP